MSTVKIRRAKLDLVAPSAEHQKSFLEGYREMEGDAHRASWLYGPFKEEDVIRDFTGFVKTSINWQTHPLPGFVTGDLYWAIRDGEVVGRIALRHQLTEALAKGGGHIGYIVRPSARRQGIASEMLRLLLSMPKAIEIGKLLVTCDEDNEPSMKTIRANGGVFSGVHEFEEGGIQKRKAHFWIGLAGD